jgi:hypothetical protein
MFMDIYLWYSSFIELVTGSKSTNITEGHHLITGRVIVALSWDVLLVEVIILAHFLGILRLQRLGMPSISEF